jgi:hypothetical protein
MALFNLANWRGPVPNMNTSVMVRPLQGLVLHIEQGTEAGTNEWFHNPGAGVSAHFGNPKSGNLDQWVDTNDKAWAQGAGNATWISLENEGYSGESLTDGQISNAAALLAWLNVTESIPMQTADSPAEPGLGYHAMGGMAWGNHPNCPGQPIVDQRADIVARAQALVIAPTISGIDPTGGAPGAVVTISGSGFTFTSSVGFGDTSVPQMSIDSDSQITAIAPVGSGTVDVVVTSPLGSSATSLADEFTYS